jgi:GH25 family lysozyme M1 (1,4-beta-N-acetylmuramidase)|nr:MAG TPA: PlyB like endolysin [Caudoviricetes sp.]
MLPIMDVSRWQGSIDWDKVKASRLVSGVMLKTVSTNRKLSKRKDGLYVDPTFERNYAECKRVGLPVGVYYYTYAVSHTSADAELALLKTALTGKTFELPVCVDVEDNKLHKLGKQALTDLTAYALATIERWGFYALLYTGLKFGKTRLYMGGAALRKYDVWLARYPRDKSKTKPEDKPKTDFSFGMWQYTSTASVPGVSGNVDLSHAYKNYEKIIAKKGLDRLREG